MKCGSTPHPGDFYEWGRLMLFLLRPIEDWEPHVDLMPWTDSFCACGFVVRASGELHARQIASEQAGDEGRDVWLDHTKTRCEAIDPNGQPEILCSDFRDI